MSGPPSFTDSPAISGPLPTNPAIIQLLKHVGLGVPPPGVTANVVYETGPGAGNIALHVICLLIATLFTGMRVYTKAVTLRSFGWDDAFFVIAWALTLVFSGILLRVHSPAYLEPWNISVLNAIDMFKWMFLAQVIFIPCIVCLKTSFFLSYMRIFGRYKVLKWLCWAGIAVNVIVNAIFFALAFYACEPAKFPAGTFDPVHTIGGKCLSVEVSPLSTAIIQSASDVYLFIIPMPFVWSVQLPLKKKIRLVALFSGGLFCCVASFARLGETIISFRHPNPTFIYWHILVISILELTLGIVCAAALTAPAFIEKVARPGFSSLSSRASKISPYIPRVQIYMPYKTSSSKPLPSTTTSSGFTDSRDYYKTDAKSSAYTHGEELHSFNEKHPHHGDEEMAIYKHTTFYVSRADSLDGSGEPFHAA